MWIMCDILWTSLVNSHDRYADHNQNQDKLLQTPRWKSHSEKWVFGSEGIFHSTKTLRYFEQFSVLSIGDSMWFRVSAIEVLVVNLKYYWIWSCSLTKCSRTLLCKWLSKLILTLIMISYIGYSSTKYQGGTFCRWSGTILFQIQSDKFNRNNSK